MTCSATCSRSGSASDVLASPGRRRRPRSGVDDDITRDPQLLGELAYEFDDWRGDDLVASAGFWLVTEGLANALRSSDLTGRSLATIRVSTSGVFDDLHPDELELPI